MFETSLDVLYMSLAMGFALLVIFLCVMIFYVILILRDATKVVDDVTGIVDKVHKTIVEPLRAMDYVMEKAKPYIDMAIEKSAKAKKATKKKK